MRLEGAGLALSGIKMAEAGDGVIVRLYECAGKAVAGHISVDPAVWGTVTGARATDLLERPQEAARVGVTGNQVGFHLEPHGLITLHLKLTRS